MKNVPCARANVRKQANEINDSGRTSKRQKRNRAGCLAGSLNIFRLPQRIKCSSSYTINTRPGILKPDPLCPRNSSELFEFGRLDNMQDARELNNSKHSETSEIRSKSYTRVSTLLSSLSLSLSLSLSAYKFNEPQGGGTQRCE